MKFETESLEKSNELLNIILHSIPSAVFIIDENYEIKDMNEGFRNLFKSSVADNEQMKMGNVLGCSFAMEEGTACGKTAHCGLCLIRRMVGDTIEKKEPIRNEKIEKMLYFNNEKQMKYMNLNTRYIEFDSRQFAIIFIDDITDHEKSKKQLEEQNQSLRELKCNLMEIVDEQTRKIRKATVSMVTALENANYFNDTDTGGHIKRVCKYSAVLAEGYGCDSEFIEKIELYASLHDIGKVGISDELLKKTGRYTDEEREKMQEHVRIGARMLENSGIEEFATNIIKYHHERYDGDGYQNKLGSQTIPLEARIVALADVYDALSTKRSYKEPYPEDKVDRIIQEGSGKHFDPDLVKVFFDNKEKLIAIREKYTGGGVAHRITTKFVGNVQVIAFEGRITFDTIDALLVEIKQVVKQAKAYVIDLLKISHIDSIGFGLIERIKAMLNVGVDEVEMLLLNDDKFNTDMFEIFGIDKRFRIYPTLDEAILSI